MVEIQYIPAIVAIMLHPNIFRPLIFSGQKGRQRQKVTIHPSEAGLTLIEMIVVLAIIALVAALIVPNVIGRPDEARGTVATADLRTVSAALKMYRLDNSSYPTTEQGLKALVEKPSATPLPRVWPEDGYLAQLPVDPWGNPYLYRSPGRTGAFDLYSLGKDGKEGGSGADADITDKTK